MQLSLVPNPQYAFNCMLETAQQLTDDLDGILRAEPHKPWDAEMAEYYQKIINQLPMIEAV